MTTRADHLVIGGRYRVRYRLAAQRRDREFVGTYLGTDYSGALQFDQRPAAGTGSLPAASLLAAELVRGDTPHTQARVVRNG